MKIILLCASKKQEYWPPDLLVGVLYRELGNYVNHYYQGCQFNSSVYPFVTYPCDNRHVVDAEVPSVCQPIGLKVTHKIHLYFY